MKSRWPLFVCLAVAAFALIQPAAGQEPAEAVVQQFVLPPMPAPTIDGAIEAKEWAGAVRIMGTHGVNIGYFLDPRECDTWVGYDDEYLYLAVSSELPPSGRLHREMTIPDQNTVGDDTIELWVDPNRENRLAGRGDQRFYQIIINDLGTSFDQVFDPTKGVPNAAWNLEGHKFRTRVNKEANRWEVEMAISWQNLGVPAAAALNRQVGLFVARNWKDPWNQAPFLPIGGFADWKAYPVLHTQPAAMLVAQEESLGPLLEKAALNYRLALRNPTAKAAEAKIKLAFASSDMPGFIETKSLIVPAGGVETVAFQVAEGRFHTNAEHTVSVTATANDGAAVFGRRLRAKVTREQKWIAGVVDEGAGFKLAYFPSLDKLRVRIDKAFLVGGDEAKTAVVRLLEGQGPRKLFEQTVPLPEAVTEQALTVPRLPWGVHTVQMQLQGDGLKAKPVLRPLERRYFPWEGTPLGRLDRAYPPFTPVQVAGRKVDVVLRDLTMSDLGLWQSVRSTDREILAAPMTLRYETAAGEGQWQGQELKLAQRSDYAAGFVAQATSPAMGLAVISTIEMDGCMKVALTLDPVPTPQEIRRLWLDIPLRDAEAPLWHICLAGTIRSNPVGSAPAGQGQVWDSTQTGNGGLPGNFLPYIWLGGAERGLCWFADSDKGWEVDDRQPCLTLTREGGTLTLRVYFVNRPVTITAPRTITFGLQASPTKPMPADFRKPEYDVPMHGGSNGYAGILAIFAGKYPAYEDWTIVDSLLAARNAHAPDPGLLARFREQHLQGADAAFVEDRTRHLGAGLNTAVGSGGQPMMIYFEEHAQDQADPAFHTYQDEWKTSRYTKRQWADRILSGNDAYGPTITPVASYRDYTAWHAAQWSLRGYGLYYDNTFPRLVEDPMISDAGTDENGQFRAATDIWAMRAYHQRTWLVEQQMRPFCRYPLFKSVHMTNGNLLPVVTWADISLDNEWAWQDGAAPFPPDVLRAEMTGRQAGNYPHALFAVMGNADKLGLAGEAFTRAEWGLRAVHEILRQPASWQKDHPYHKLNARLTDFGYGTDQCVVLNYWAESEAAPAWVKFTSPDVLWLAASRQADGHVLLVAFNWAKEPRQVALTMAMPEGKVLGSLTDVETDAAVDPKTLRFGGWELKFLEAAPMPPPGPASGQH